MTDYLLANCFSMAKEEDQCVTQTIDGLWKITTHMFTRDHFQLKQKHIYALQSFSHMTTVLWGLFLNGYQSTYF